MVRIYYVREVSLTLVSYTHLILYVALPMRMGACSGLSIIMMYMYLIYVESFFQIDLFEIKSFHFIF